MGRKVLKEEFLDRLDRTHGGNIVALDEDEYICISKPMRFQCKLGHIWPETPNNVLRGHGCPYCAGNFVWVGYNDLWTTRPDVASLLQDPNDGYKYSQCSDTYVNFICPYCGLISRKRIADVSMRGFSCQFCSDGVSYPNKFARIFFNQLPVKNYDCEHHPDWGKPYIYDNYFIYNDMEYVVEFDGEQHYRDGCFFTSLDERQLIDNNKTELAIKNNIKIIRIDCMKSECNYIKNSILSSELANIFDLSRINWDMCDRLAQKSLIKQVCELYMSGIKNFNEIGRILQIDRKTAYNYAKAGAKLNLCNYDPMLSKTSISVAIVDDNGTMICQFCSINACRRHIKNTYKISISSEKIQESCQTHKPYKGFNFRFANETIQN